MSIYQDEGFSSRRDYLVNLAQDFGVDEHYVFMMAGVLGPNEDFDGLVSMVDDFASRTNYENEEE